MYSTLCGSSVNPNRTWQLNEQLSEGEIGSSVKWNGALLMIEQLFKQWQVFYFQQNKDKTEEEAKVVAAVWGTEVIQSIAALAILL